MKALLTMTTLAVLLAGCTQGPAQEPDEGAVLGDDLIGGPQPVRLKDRFPTAQPALLPAVMPGEPAMTFDVAADGSTVHLAFDLDGTAGPQVMLRVVFAGGRTQEVATTDPGKQVVVVDDVDAGTASLYAESSRSWTVGAVVTVFPPGFVEGTRVQVSTPEQTDIEHRFYPAQVTAMAGQPSRLTLYDYDPHAGIENLQHNINFPGLGLKTEGKTTWGEVRVLDLPPLAAGTYPFECEFHGFTGQLTIA